MYRMNYTVGYNRKDFAAPTVLYLEQAGTMYLNKKKMRKVNVVACTIQVTQITFSLRCGITTQK